MISFAYEGPTGEAPEQTAAAALRTLGGMDLTVSYIFAVRGDTAVKISRDDSAESALKKILQADKKLPADKEIIARATAIGMSFRG
jgi:hypothetical protein